MAEVDLERLIDERARAIVAEREAAKEAGEVAKQAAEEATARAEHVEELTELAQLCRHQLATLRPAWGLCVLTAVGLFLFLATSLIGLLEGRERAEGVVILAVELLVSVVAAVGHCLIAWKRRLALAREELASAEVELGSLASVNQPGDPSAPYR